MSTPADRIRRALSDASKFVSERPYLQGSVDSELGRTAEHLQDALAALAELERERDRHAEVREIITSVVCGALNRAGINEVDNPGVAIDAIRNRAENAERERDELRAKLTQAESTIAFEQKNLAHQSERMAELRANLAEYEQAPTVAYLSIDCIGERYLIFSQPQDKDELHELIARPTRKDGE